MKFKCRNILFTTIVSLLFLILSSCSSSETVTTSSSQEVEISSDSSQPSLEIAVKEVEPVVPEVEPVLPVTVLDHAGNTVIINEHTKVIYSPDKPLSCGAKVWIETTEEVELV